MFRFTLRAVRISCGYTIEEAAALCGIPTTILSKFEKDSSSMPFQLLNKLINLYGISLNVIYFGAEAECIRQNRQMANRTKTA